MKPEDQRIAIAEACGWHHCHCTGGLPCGIPPWVRENVGDDDYQQETPKFTSDLNAMHEAEKVLNETQRYRYIDLLVGKDWPEAWLITDAEKAIRSTASQRAEAFLKCLGLWKD